MCRLAVVWLFFFSFYINPVFIREECLEMSGSLRRLISPREENRGKSVGISSWRAKVGEELCLRGNRLLFVF